jgi:hypothetical protein
MSAALQRVGGVVETDGGARNVEGKHLLQSWQKQRDYEEVQGSNWRFVSSNEPTPPCML